MADQYPNGIPAGKLKQYLLDKGVPATEVNKLVGEINNSLHTGGLSTTIPAALADQRVAEFNQARYGTSAPTDQQRKNKDNPTDTTPEGQAALAAKAQEQAKAGDTSSAEATLAKMKVSTQLNQLYGRPILDSDWEHILKVYNEGGFSHDGGKATDVADLSVRLQSMDPTEMQHLVVSAANGSTAIHWVPITGDGNTMTMKSVQADIWNAARNYVNQNDQLLDRVFQVADKVGVDWQMLLAAAKGSSAFNPADPMNTEGQAPFKPKTGNEQPPWLQGTGVGFGAEAPQPTQAQTAAGQTANMASRLNDVATRLKKGLAKYNNKTLAMIAAITDESTADYVKQNAPDLDKATADKINQKFLDSGFNPSDMAKVGLYINPDDWAGVTKNSGGTTTGNKVVLDDREQLKGTLTDLMRRWFRRDPTADEIARFSGTMDSMQTAAQQPAGKTPGRLFGDDAKPLDITVTAPDMGAQAEAQLKNSAEYQQLFGNKPAGMSEDQYVSSFENQNRSIFGNALSSDEAIRQGMMTGSQNTSLQYLAGTKEAQTNSTFQGRLASMAQLINSLT